jgi:hypothetical protein
MITPGELVALDDVLAKVRAEIVRARSKHDRFHSPHEAYAVLLEEVDELWDDVKANRLEPSLIEAVQVAAMAVRYILDLKDRVDPASEV